MNGYEKKEGDERNDRDEIFSKVVRAGKRTYFLDVKATRRNDYYLTITESKKRFNRDGRHYFEKHKIFLYKEDFEKFVENLNEAIGFIKNSDNQIIDIDSTENQSEEPTILNEVVNETKEEVVEELVSNESYSANVDFDDLDNKIE